MFPRDFFLGTRDSEMSAGVKNSNASRLFCSQGFYTARGIDLDMKVTKTLMKPSDLLGTVLVGSGMIFDQDDLPFMCIQVATDVIQIKKDHEAEKRR